jgi:hypothetical protein
VKVSQKPLPYTADSPSISTPYSKAPPLLPPPALQAEGEEEEESAALLMPWTDGGVVERYLREEEFGEGRVVVMKGSGLELAMNGGKMRNRLQDMASMHMHPPLYPMLSGGANDVVPSPESYEKSVNAEKMHPPSQASASSFPIFDGVENKISSGGSDANAGSPFWDTFNTSPFLLPDSDILPGFPSDMFSSDLFASPHPHPHLPPGLEEGFHACENHNRVSPPPISPPPLLLNRPASSLNLAASATSLFAKESSGDEIM